MKREIKFRVWNRDKECFYNSNHTIGINNENKAIWGDAELYTGLKDKNGKEIYEGDIVQVRREFYNIHNEEQDHDKTYTGEVVLIPSKGMCLKNPKWYCWITDTNGKDKNYKPFSAYKSEVIGNIHEHSNLLQEA